MQEASFTGEGGAGVVRVRVVEPFHVPVPVRGQAGNAFVATGHQLPQLAGRLRSSREPAAHAHDDDRVVTGAGAVAGQGGTAGGGFLLHAGDLGPYVVGHRERRRVVEHERGRQAQPRGRAHAVAEFDCGEGVEAQLGERPLGLYRLAGVVPEHGSRLSPHQILHQLVLLCRGEGEEGAPEGCGAIGADIGLPPVRHPDQRPQHQRSHLRTYPQGSHVDPDRHQHGLVGQAAGQVEELKPLLRGQRRQTTPGHTPKITAVQLPRHRARLGPQPPCQRLPRESFRPPDLGQGVQERVRRGVVRLTCTTEHPGGGGEQREHRQIHVTRQFMKVPGGVDLRPHHRCQPLRCQRGHHAVIQHTGGVHHADERVLGP